MAEVALKAIIGADGTQLTKTLADLEKDLKDFEAQLKKTSNIDALKGINSSIDTTKKQIAALKQLQNPFTGVVKGGNEATQTLIGLSRVAQDAPYGFIGIANNLNPLLESFQRLKAETSSSSLALKALGSSLMGPAGIGLALGVVSSLLVKYGDQLFNSKNKADLLKEATEKAKKETEEFISTLDDLTKAQLEGAQSAQKELLNLNLLYKASQNHNLSLNERKKAVDALQEQYPKYFKNISDEVILAGGAEKAYNKLADAILNAARARAGQDKLAELAKEELVLDEQRLAALQGEYDALQRLNREKFKQQQAGTTSEASFVTRNLPAAQKEYNKALEKTAELTKKIADNRERQKRLSEDLTSNIETQGIDIILDPTGNLPAEKKAKIEKTMADVAKWLRDRVAAMGLEIEFDVVPKFKDFVPGSQVDKWMEGEKGQYEGGLQGGLVVDEDAVKKSMEAWMKQRTEMESLQKFLEGQLTPAFQDFFSALTTGGQNAFEVLGKAIRDMVAQLIASLAAMAAVSALMAIIFPGSAGFAKTFGANFSRMSGFKIPGHAKGVVVPPGFQNDTYMARLTSGETVVPEPAWKEIGRGLAQTMGMGGGRMQNINITLDGAIQGDKLALMIAKITRSQNKYF